MTNDVKALQQLAEASGGSAPLDWSTISHTHGGGPTRVADVRIAAADLSDSLSVIQQLQQLPQAAGASTMEWSTISHTHAI